MLFGAFIINLIESVQRKFTKCIIGVKNMTYEERLKFLNIPSLEFNTEHEQFKNFLTNRIVNVWNGLPVHVVRSESTNSFKNQIDKISREHLYSINVVSTAMLTMDLAKPLLTIK